MPSPLLVVPAAVVQMGKARARDMVEQDADHDEGDHANNDAFAFAETEGDAAPRTRKRNRDVVLQRRLLCSTMNQEEQKGGLAPPAILLVARRRKTSSSFSSRRSTNYYHDIGDSYNEDASPWSRWHQSSYVQAAEEEENEDEEKIVGEFLRTAAIALGGEESSKKVYGPSLSSEDGVVKAAAASELQHLKYGSPQSGNPQKIIARELNMLTPEERQYILHDLHGVSDDIISGPRFYDNQNVVSKALADLQELLHHERLQEGNVLLRLAEKQYPERMNSRDFLLMFLRANEFKPRIAMDRIVLHLEQQQQLFGDAKVGKRITMTDLRSSERLALESGHIQILPESDRSGRIVVFIDAVASWRTDCSSNRREIFVDAMLRAAYYVLMAGLEDNEQAQECGMVLVLSYLVLGDGTAGIGSLRGPLRTDNLPSELATFLEGAARLFQGLPLKLRALHACMTPQASFDEGFYALQRFLNTDWRLRSRIHRGSLADCRSALNSFGIPSSRLPLNDSLSIVREQHLEWMRNREEIESQLLLAEASGARSFLIPLRSARGTAAPPSDKNGGPTAPSTMIDIWNSSSSTRAGSTPLAPAEVEQKDDDNIRSNAMVSAFNHHFDHDDNNVDHADLHLPNAGAGGGVTTTMMIATPSRQDVLFGRGRPIQEHSGNVLLNSLIEAVRGQREGLPRRDKSMVSQMIVSKVKQAGGRFLKQSSSNPNMWEEADDEAARVKVSHAFRSLRQSQKLREAASSEEARNKSEKTKQEESSNHQV